jgi:hypothetical protein
LIERAIMNELIGDEIDNRITSIAHWLQVHAWANPYSMRRSRKNAPIPNSRAGTDRIS